MVHRCIRMSVFVFTNDQLTIKSLLSVSMG